MSSLVSWILFGLLAGVVAKFLMPENDRGGWPITCSLGIGGAVASGLVTVLIGFPIDGTWSAAGFVLAVEGALILLYGYRVFLKFLARE